MRATVRPAGSAMQFILDTAEVCFFVAGSARVVAQLDGDQVVAILSHYLALAELTAELAVRRVQAAADDESGEPLPRRRLRHVNGRRLRGLR